MNFLRPKDKVAIIALILITILKLNGADGNVDLMGALVLGYYFAHRGDGTDTGK